MSRRRTPSRPGRRSGARSAPRPAPQPGARPAADGRALGTVPVELAVAPGLVDLALHELRELARRSRRPIPAVRCDDDAIALAWPGAHAELHDLRTVQFVSRVWAFDVPRPKALLGDEALRTLRQGLQQLATAAPFMGLRLSAAGRDSVVMRRLATALADAVGLEARDDGDLLVRVRRGERGGWEVLARTTPRPLSVRAWRVCDRPGGLDAALAAALLRWVGVRPRDRVCNPMLGGGTMLIERALAGPAACLDGFDVDAEALACAERNAAAAGVAERLRVWQADATSASASAPSERYDLQVADPPWGDAVGDRADNAALYAGLLAAAAARAAPEGRLLLVTHEVRLAERLLPGHPRWHVVAERRVWQGGHRPACLWLARRP